MSRPKDLPSALQSWATGNYGAGPAWGGTPQRAAPAGSALVPGVSLPAENANYLHGNAFDLAQGVANMAGELPALNWGNPISIGQSVGCIAWSDSEQSWYALHSGSTASFRSQDYGRTWPGITTNSTATALDAAVDTGGNIVVIRSAGNVENALWVSYGNVTWATTAAAVSSWASASVVYDSVHSLWIAIGHVTGTGKTVFTSSNRTAWTSRTIPATWSTSGSATVFIGYGNGIAVAVFNDSATTVRTMRSADGGITWTNDQQLSPIGITSAIVSRPVWSATDALWYFTVSQTGTRKTTVYSSPDAITWTAAASIGANDVCMFQIAALGSLLVGLNDDGRVFCSVNKGANWFRCGVAGTGAGTLVTFTDIKAGGGGLMAFASIAGPTTWFAPSARFGMPATAV